MKFVHIADIHFDRAFINLSDREYLGDKKRLEQRKIFKEVINYIKENNIEMLFITGDLYEQNYVKKSTIEYINNLFNEIPNTKIMITPGNHDPYLKNSYYNKFKWSQNVKIFTSKIEKVEIKDIDIYGYGFDDFYCTDCGLKDFTIENPSKTNILLMHGTLDGANLKDKQYNSVSRKELTEKGFDYVGLGHIHNNNFEKGKTILYPGSLTALGFDELKEHGMIVGDIQEKQIQLEYMPLDGSKFIEKEIDITKINSKEELIETLNEIKISEKEYAKIILVGERNFEIDIYELYKLIDNIRIIKIKNKTKINCNLGQLANETTLKGLFAKEMKEKIENDEITKDEIEILEKAVEIGLEALK